MSSNHKRRWAVLALALTLALALSLPAMAARQAQTPSPGATQTPAPGVALLRMVQASPDAPALMVFLNDDRTFCDLGFARVTRYEYVSPGAYTIRVNEAPESVGPFPATTTGTPPAAGVPRGPGGGPPAGVTPGVGAARRGPPAGVTPLGRPGGGPPEGVTPGAGPPASVTPLYLRAVAAGTADLAASTAYSSVLVGTVDTAEVLILQDDLSAPPAGKAKVRFVNASPNAPALDLVEASGPTLSTGVAYKQASGYVEATPGPVDLELRDAATGNVLATLSGVSLGDGTVYTVYAAGMQNGQPPLQALLVVESVDGLAVPTS